MYRQQAGRSSAIKQEITDEMETMAIAWCNVTTKEEGKLRVSSQRLQSPWNNVYDEETIRYSVSLDSKIGPEIHHLSLDLS